MTASRPFICSAALLAALAGCVQPPLGPRVAVMPAANKPFDVFAGEDASCRQYASSQTAGGAEQANNQAVGSAVVGTVLGAALGAAVGGGRGAAIGAGTGAVVGTAAGSGPAAYAQYSLQQRYDISYAQCMASHGNQVAGYRPPPAYAYPPGYPPPGYAPPPGYPPPG
jgi:hypothetical protein